MVDALSAAHRRMRRLRLVYAAAVVAGGSVAALNVAVLVGAAALAAAAHLGQPANVLPVTKALLSTALAVTAYYLIARPLYRHFRLPDFARLLERSLGRETYLLTACQLAAQAGGGRREAGATDGRQAGGGRPEAEFSTTLLAEVGARALRDHREVRLSSTGAVRFLGWQALLAIFLLGGSLLLNMSRPDAIQSALVRLFTRPVQAAEGNRPPQRRAVVAEPHTPARRPPCRTLRLRAAPPDYLGGEPFSLAWNRAARFAAGTRLELFCVPFVEGQLLVLEEHRADEVVEHPFVPDGGEAGAEELRTALILEQPSELYVTATPGRVQPGMLRAQVQVDQAPLCRLLQPADSLELDENDSLSLLAEVRDDGGIGVVEVRYRVEGLDSEWASIELARPAGQRQLLVQRDLPLSSFGADPGDTVTIRVEGADLNTFSGPSRCHTEERRLTVRSRHSLQREMVEALADLRGRAIDLVGAGLLLADGAPAAAELRRFEADFGANLKELEEVAGTMGRSNLFKEEDSRRAATLAAAAEEILLEDEAPDAEVQRWVPVALREVEQQTLVLDGLVEKLMGEVLFLHANRVQRELEQAVAIARDAAGHGGGERAVRRTMRRLKRAARRAVRFAAATQPVMPALFSSTLARQEAGWFEQVEELAGKLAESPVGSGTEAWRSQLDALSLAVERAVRSVEGAYAQSMTRLSSSFRNAQDELLRRLRRAMELNSALRKDLEALQTDVARETKEYIKRRKTIEQARSLARTVRSLSRKARRFRAATYLKVDRNQVVEFREKLARLSEMVGVLKFDEASALASDLVSLTNSMEFSLKLSIRYSKDDALVERSRKELEKVRDARKLAESVHARLTVIRPQRSKLKSLRSENLEAVQARLDKLQQELFQVREKVEGLNKLFPIFFGKFGPLLDRTIESLGQLREHLGELMLEEANRLALFTDESLARLIDSLENASRNARTASALSAGGSQPALELAGKEESVSRERLQRYLDVGMTMGEKKEWQQVIGAYFQQLSP